MSKSEFQSAIQQQLRKDGVFDEITVAVRSRILQSLLNENGSTEAATAISANVNKQGMALLSLLYHFLEQKQYSHTLSVFAAESQIECSLAYPLSPTAAIKALGLQVVWREFEKGNQDLSVDLPSLLQAVAHWVSLQQENDTAATELLQSSKNADPAQSSKSVQTEEIVRPTRNDADGDIENDKENDRPNQCNSSKTRKGYYNEASIIEIERECQQRMRQEMNEKLKLSAKKQAAHAARRLEQKHKEELQSLRQHIEVERSRARHRQEELIEQLSQQQLLSQRKQVEIEQRLETASLEKQTLQSEMDLLNERVKEIQKARFKEWADEHEVLQRKHNESMIQLEEQRKFLQMQINDIDSEKDAIRAKERQNASLNREKSNLLAEINDLRNEQVASLALQQSSFDEAQSDIQKQLSKLQEKYRAARSDLDASRNEVSGLRSLLKQSQSIMESVSFREIGKASADVPSAVNSRNAIRAIPGAHRVSFSRPHLAAPSMTDGDSLHPLLIGSSGVEKSSKHERTTRITPTNYVKSIPNPREDESRSRRGSSEKNRTDVPPLQSGLNANENPPNHERTSSISTNSCMRLNTNPPDDESRSRLGSNESNRPGVQPQKPEDPPCSSAEDPPENENNGNEHIRPMHTCAHEMKMKTCPMDPVVGREIVLNISSITEEVLTAEKESNMVEQNELISRTNGHYRNADGNQTKDDVIVNSMNISSCNPEEKMSAFVDAGNLMDVSPFKASYIDMVTPPNRPKSAESELVEHDADTSVHGTMKIKSKQMERIEHEDVSIEGSLKLSQVDDSKSVNQSSMSSPRESGREMTGIVINAQISKSSVAESEQYSERFNTFSEGINQSSASQDNNHASVDQAGSDTDFSREKANMNKEHREEIRQSSNPHPGSPFSESSVESSSDGYSESFCS